MSEGFEDSGKTLQSQKIWESMIFPKAYRLENRLFRKPVIFFVIAGSIKIEVNSSENVHPVFSHEMFMTQRDNSYVMIMQEQTHVLVCHVPMETWFIEQKWIDGLLMDEKNQPQTFFKLPQKKNIIRYLSLLYMYLKEAAYPPYFYELKRQEFFFLLFSSYQKNDLAQFLRCILSRDIQFMKIVMNNCFNAKNVQDLAKYANYSSSGFIKKFQKCFNDSPYKWMQKQKAKQIFVEITSGIKSLQEIANEYKFSSYQHFSVFCKTQLGAPPTEVLSMNRVKNAYE